MTFKCADGEQKCEKVYLAQSEFFSDKIEGFERLNNDLEFGRGLKAQNFHFSLVEETKSKDYTNFSKTSVKTFIDLLHHIDVEIETLHLSLVLEILFFLHCEGKTQTSEFESKLADYLYDELVLRDMNDDTTLMLVCFLSSLDNYNTRFEDERAVKLKNESIKDINMNFDPKSSQYLSIVQVSFIDVPMS